MIYETDNLGLKRAFGTFYNRCVRLFMLNLSRIYLSGGTAHLCPLNLTSQGP